MPESKKTYQKINIAFIITTIIGTLISSFTIYCILDLIFKFTFNADEFIFPFIFVLLYFIAPICSIIAMINYIMLKKLREIKLPKIKYVIAYLSIFANSIPAFIIIGTIFYHMFRS